MPMVGHSGFTPVEAAHMVDSGTCATCHTLFTDAVDADAKPIGSHFPEQTPYLEWRNSAYSTESEPAGMQAATCQDCHVPTQSVDGVPISTRIAHRPDGSDFPSISDRAPVGRHVFVGGNTLMPAIIDANAADLQPRAGSEAFSAVIDAARDQLANRTAEVSIVDVVRDGDLVRVQVRVDVETGHKFPTGFPSRRAWLKVAVVDAGETTIFESGGFDGEGRIVDAGGSPLAAEAAGGPVLGHRDRIDDASQVQVYEAIMSDAEGQAAYRLLRATEYLKDNRVLPVGWSSDGPHADETAPAGVDDDDFVGGSDVVTYEIQAPAAAGPYQLRVELLYQPLGARFAAELFELSAPEIEAFESMFDAADKSPVQVSSVSQQVQ
jgi:hypothetical protein